MSKVKLPLKIALRKEIKRVIGEIPADLKRRQSDAITKTVTSTEVFKEAKRVSIFLSMTNEVDTTGILMEMFKQKKEVFIPICTENVSEMVKLSDMRDYESLPCTKFGLKQPATVENRENAMETGGIDLFIVPGLLFSIKGSRLGHGLGFYDKYFQRHHEKYPQKKTVLMAIAFLEQVVKEGLLPVEEHDVLMDFVVTENCVYSSK